MASSAFAVTVFELLTEGQAREVRQASTRTTAADGVPPLSEEARLRVAPDERGATHLVVADDDEILAYAQLDVVAAAHQPSAEEATAELFVAPEWRGRGIGAGMLGTARELAPNLFVWSHGDLPPARRLAARFGFARVRELRQLRAPLDEPPPEPALPEGIRIRTFTPGRDEPAWLALNARAFASHPEQGGWTEHDLALREQEVWFDPEGFFLAERGNRLVGFHWTKVEDGLGEVYVLGVDPDEAGHGLGSVLTAIGLRHLHERGLRTVLLYVEATNAPALAVYERAGFHLHAVDVGYRSPADGSD